MSRLRQRIVLAPADGSLGPLLRVADDRLPAGAGYGRHAHRAVDVVAIVLAGSVSHRWADGVAMTAGDVAVLRSGTGVDHDEVAGGQGARVLQCYLRAGDLAAPPAHEVHRGPAGWLDLRRDDARLWLGRAAPGVPVRPPPGLLLVAGEDGVTETGSGRELRLAAPATLVVWQLETARPAWAAG